MPWSNASMSSFHTPGFGPHSSWNKQQTDQYKGSPNQPIKTRKLLTPYFEFQSPESVDHQRAATHYQLLAVGVLNAVGKIFNNRTQLLNAWRKESLITMIFHQVVPLLYIGSSLELRAIVARVLKSQWIKRTDKSKSLNVCTAVSIQSGVKTDFNIRWGRAWRGPALLVSPALVFLWQVINND